MQLPSADEVKSRAVRHLACIEDLLRQIDSHLRELDSLVGGRTGPSAHARPEPGELQSTDFYSYEEYVEYRRERVLRGLLGR